MADEEFENSKPEQTGPLDITEATRGAEGDAESIVGTSSQRGAGKAALPQGDAVATIADDDDIATPIAPMRLDPSAADDDAVAGHVNPDERRSDAVRES